MRKINYPVTAALFGAEREVCIIAYLYNCNRRFLVETVI